VNNFALAFFLSIVVLGIAVVRRLSTPRSPAAVTLPPGITQQQIEKFIVAALYRAAAHAPDPSIRLSAQTHAAELGGRYPLRTVQTFVRWRHDVETCARGFRCGPGRESIEYAIALSLHLEAMLAKGAAR
jgi:hypothetical protein